MSKKFLFGLAALLSVSLFMLGCPQEADESAAEKSADASLTKVKGVDITWGAGTGADSTGNIKNGTVTVDQGTASVAAGDFTAAAGATVKVYDVAADLSGTGESETVDLTAGITTNVYVLVTAEDGATKLYYKVSIALPKTVSTYSLKASEASEAGAAASGVTLASATELDGVVTLRLGGTITSKYILKAPGAGENAYTEGGNFQPSENVPAVYDVFAVAIKETAGFQQPQKCGGEKPHQGRRPTAVFRSPRALLRPKHIQSCYVPLCRTLISLVSINIFLIIHTINQKLFCPIYNRPPPWTAGGVR